MFVAVVVSVALLLGLQHLGYSHLQRLGVSYVVVLAVTYGILALFIRLQGTEPVAGRRIYASDVLEEVVAPAELKASKATLPKVMRQISERVSVLLFGQAENQWLWLIRRDGAYHIQLVMYPKELRALQQSFSRAAWESGLSVTKEKCVLQCNLGRDEETAAEKAWLIFTATMGLSQDVTVAMKRL